MLAAVVWRGQAAAGTDGHTVTLSIVGTADLHGRIEAQDERGGLALLGGYLANLRAARAADGGAVVLLDGGDTFQGGIASNLSEGAVVVDAYNALGYAALAVGNHDFEYGAVDHWDEPAGRSFPGLSEVEGGSAESRLTPDDPRGALKARAAQARFPFLAANLIDEATARPVDWPNVRPSAIVEAAGVTVGLIGVMTAGALSMTLAANVQGLTVAPLAPAIAREAQRLRAGGAQLVVVAAHAGGACMAFDDPADLRSCDGAAEMFDVLRRLPRGTVDAVVGGHTHAAVAHVVEGVPIVQAFNWGRSFARVDLVVDRDRGAVTATRVFPPREICAYETGSQPGICVTASAADAVPARYEGQPVVADPAVAAAMAPALARVQTLREMPLDATLDAPLDVRVESLAESPLGNLFADAMRASTPGADAALSYGWGPGGLRAGLGAGAVTRGALYDTFPFDNRVVRLELSGGQLRRLLTDHVRRPRWGARALGVAGIQVRIGCRDGALHAEVSRASGAPIGDDERLVLAATDFMTARLPGGVVPGDDGRASDVLLREVVERWIRGAGRLRAARFADPAQPRWTSEASDPCPAAP